jgi:hypothetical protein
VDISLSELTTVGIDGKISTEFDISVAYKVFGFTASTKSELL